MLVVVSDTSPLRCLVHVDQLLLLDQLFSSVVIPPAVLEELRFRLKTQSTTVLILENLS